MNLPSVFALVLIAGCNLGILELSAIAAIFLWKMSHLS